MAAVFFNTLFVYFVYLSVVVQYLKLYLIFFTFVILYKPKVLAIVLFFIILYFFFKKKIFFDNFSASEFYNSEINRKLRFFKLHSAICDNSFFLKNYKEKSSFFTYSFANFFLVLFTFIYCFALLFYFILFFSYDAKAYNYISNWMIYSCQVLSISFDWLIYLDAIAMYFIILTTFIFFLVFLNLFSIKFKKDYKKNYLNFKLLLFLLFYIEICLILTFSTSNIFFFFFFLKPL